MIFKQEKKVSNIVYHRSLFSQLNSLSPKQIAGTAGFFIVNMTCVTCIRHKQHLHLRIQTQAHL